MKNRWGRWIAAILLWSTLGLLFALPGLSSGNWHRTLVGSLAQWWSWGLVTPLIFWADSRLPFKENQLGMRILAHLLASVVLTMPLLLRVRRDARLLGIGAWSVLADKSFFELRSAKPFCGVGLSIGPSSARNRLSDTTNTISPVNCGWSEWSATFPKHA